MAFFRLEWLRLRALELQDNGFTTGLKRRAISNGQSGSPCDRRTNKPVFSRS
jgi:hypothetical protein